MMASCSPEFEKNEANGSDSASSSSSSGSEYQVTQKDVEILEEKIRRQQIAERKTPESPWCRKAKEMPKLELKIRPQKGERGKKFKILGVADTGCSRFSCGPKVPKMYGYRIKNYAHTPVATYTASGERMTHMGQVNVIVEANGQEVEMPMNVIKELGDLVFLSKRDLIDFKSIPPNFPQRYDLDDGSPEHVEMIGVQSADDQNNNKDTPATQRLKGRLERLSKNYKATVFSKEIKSIIGGPQKLVIDEELMKEKPPRKWMTARNCPKHLQPGAAEQVKKMLAQGVIRKIPNDEVTPFVCPVGFTPKNNREKLGYIPT